MWRCLLLFAFAGCSDQSPSSISPTYNAGDQRSSQYGDNTGATDFDPGDHEVPLGDERTAGDQRTPGDDSVAGDDYEATFICGNNIPESPEACDDGNRDDGDYCSADCMTITGRCGDAIEQTNEGCDDGVVEIGCDILHDGGDGVCRPAGVCSVGYYLDGAGDCVPETSEVGIHIYVDNFCNLWTVPEEVVVPPEQSGVSFTYYNHSVDYEVDVWMSYGGGYLDLATGDSWDDQYDHCYGGARPYDAAADISIAGLGVNDPYCPGHRLLIHCQ